MITKRIIFHVPFKLGYAISGGGIRPGKLIQAFHDLGYIVDVVSGTKAQRIESMNAIMENMRNGINYDFCYAETSVLPTMLTEKGNKAFYPFVDFDFFRFVKDRGTPLGLFYRDIYWRFKYYQKDHPFLERMRRIFFYHLDLWYYGRMLDTLFLPSQELAEYLPASLREIALECPPGHDIKCVVDRPLPQSAKDLSILYVGGVSTPVYDISPLMKLGKTIPVTVCCRKEEWNTYQPHYEPWTKNVNIRHIHGNELSDLYGQVSLSSIVRVDHDYLSFASPLKLYEAVGQNIPLLVSRGTRAARFVEDNNIGWTVENDFSDLNLDRLIHEYPEKVENLKTIKDAHSWTARATLIRDNLLKHRTDRHTYV
ncbi:MAG: hypothetical protein JEY79_05685 [Pseudodesulfovibrio sp.]|nr:hypothetical protein [Pseudodesulfovibrio sp.]